MTPQELSDAYAAVAHKHGLPDIVPARCRLETRALSEPGRLLEELLAYQPRRGWLQFQSHIAAFDGSAPPKPSPDWGVLLAAETVDAEGRSIHLRHRGAEGWMLVLCTPTEKTDPTAEPTLVLADEVRQLATDKAPGPLRYRRYWRLDPDPSDRNDKSAGPVPAFAAFIGFGTKEDR